MKIVSWNINGLRATLRSVSGSDMRSLLDGLGADIICFQETKATRDQIDESLYLVDGYNAYFSFCQTKKGYSGVVTFCRNSATPIAAEEGLTGILSSGGDIGGYGDLSAFTDDELSVLDSEGRAVLTEHCFIATDAPAKKEGGEERPMGPATNSEWAGYTCAMEVTGHGKIGPSLVTGDGKLGSSLVTGDGTIRSSPARGEGDEKRVVIVNVYCPMYDPAKDEKGEGLSRLHYKMNFYRLLEARCTALEQAGKAVLAVGDFNCSTQAIDSAYMMDDPSLGKDSQSRDWMRQFAVTQVPPSNHHSPSSLPQRPLRSPPLPSSSHTTLLDTYRYLHPTEEGAYTCWSTLLDSRKTNYGTRIDYILSSFSLAHTLIQAEVWQHIQGSDHCPVFAEFELEFIQSRQLPSLCSCWFSGRQSKLSNFLTSSAKPGGVVSTKASAVNTKSTVEDTKGNEVKAEGTKLKPGDIEVKAGGTKFKAGGTKFKPGGTKRTKKYPELPPPKRTLGQKSLLSFSASTSQVVPRTDCAVEFKDSPAQAQGELSAAWKTVFGCGPKAPPCSGHNEPCVLRTVKKQGPNKDRQFWVCARPMGSKGDPLARCDFFKWVKEKSKK